MKLFCEDQKSLRIIFITLAVAYFTTDIIEQLTELLIHFFNEFIKKGVPKIM